MGFFTKKQVKLSSVAFNLNDFEELNYNQLVEVNGGCGGGFWAGVRNFFSGGKNSSGNPGSASGSSSASRGSSGYSSSSPSGSTSYTTSSSYGGCGGNSSKSKKNIYYSSNNYISYNKDPDQNPNLTVMIESSIISHRDDKYIVSSRSDMEWRCDNYAEAIVDQAGCDVSKIFAGAPTKNTVQNHIDYGKKNYNLTENKKKSAPSLSNGAYVIFMNDSYKKSSITNKPYEPHCGLIIVRNGSVLFSDNSSQNNKGKGGASTSEYKSLQKFQNDYAYNNFYYQPIAKRKD